MNYTEAYYIFQDFNSTRQMGICMANLGAIHMQERHFGKAKSALDEASDILRQEI